MRTKTTLALVSCIALFALSGCGFSPVYGDYANRGQQGQVSAALDRVYIDSIPDRSGQKLRNELMDRFYRTGRKNLEDAQYRLRISAISENIYGLGIAKDATATRSQIKLRTEFTLTMVGDAEGKPLIQRTVESISSFDTLASEYTTLVTEDDARDQVIRDMADQVAVLLELYFTNPSKFPAPVAPVPVDPNDKNKPDLTRDAHAYIDEDVKRH